MGRQLDWATGKPEAEDQLLSSQSDTEAFAGHAMKARELSNKAVDVAKRNGQKETGAVWLLDAALRDAELKNSAQARQQATSAIALSSNRDSQILQALVLARTGDTDRAQRMADDIAKRSPLNTVLNRYWLPTILAAVELNRGHPQGAISLLEAASEYELGSPSPGPGAIATLYPVYVRGEAYMKAGQGAQAAAEFQKIIDHRNLVQNFVLGALAHLATGSGQAHEWRQRRCAQGLPGFSHPLERRRPRHPHPEGSQGGVCEVAVTASSLDNCLSVKEGAVRRNCGLNSVWNELSPTPSAIFSQPLGRNGGTY